MTPSTHRKTYLVLGILLGFGSHGRVMFDTAVAAAYGLHQLYQQPGTTRLVFPVLAALALVGSAMLIVSGWWRSVYRERWEPLISTMLTGVACVLVTRSIALEHYAATWLALVLISLVLYAGIDSARALWRELGEPKPMSEANRGQP